MSITCITHQLVPTNPKMAMNPGNNSSSFLQRFMRNLVKLTIGLGIIYVFYAWTNQPDTSVAKMSHHRRSAQTVPLPWIKENRNYEWRIARHFEFDTLPGLMRRGLVKKYERHQTGTKLFVAGDMWKKRSRFFMESLLTEVLVYNTVHGYARETQIIDHRSQQLYARAVSADRKEFFD
jgi:hypothetical protein